MCDRCGKRYQTALICTRSAPKRPHGVHNKTHVAQTSTLCSVKLFKCKSIGSSNSGVSLNHKILHLLWAHTKCLMNNKFELVSNGFTWWLAHAEPTWCINFIDLLIYIRYDCQHAGEGLIKYGQAGGEETAQLVYLCACGHFWTDLPWIIMADLLMLFSGFI